MEASLYGHTATVQLLLEAGADNDAKTVVRETKRMNLTHLHTWLTRWFGVFSPCDLFPSLWLRLVHVRPGAWPERRCFFFVFFLTFVKQPFVGCQMQKEHVFPFLFDLTPSFFMISFSVWHLLSHERILRVNRGAEDALERFEELKKLEKMKISVASFRFSHCGRALSCTLRGRINSTRRCE